jgi:hypothetical protein
MRLKTTFASILATGLATALAIAQSAPGDLVDSASSAKKTQIDPALRAPVRLVSVVDASGKQTLVLASGQKLTGDLARQKTATRLALSGFSPALAKAKAAESVSVSTMSVSSGTMPVITPGQTVFVGTTGGTTPSSAGPIGTGLDTVVVSAPVTGGSSALSANPLAASIERQVFVGDLARDTTAMSRGLTVGASTPTAGGTEIGPNGFPVPVTSTAAQSTPAVGANGFPLLGPAGVPTGQLISPNGFPLVAPFIQTGSTSVGTTPSATLPAAVPTTASPVIGTTGVTAPTATTSTSAAPTVASAASPR